MITRIIIIAAILMSLLSATGAAQEEMTFAGKGIFEVGGTAAFQAITPVANGQNGNATTGLMLEPFFGYFVTDGFELGFNPFGFATTHSGNFTQTELFVLVAPSYNFHETGSTYPFIEALLGFASVSNTVTESGVAWGGRMGIKHELARHLLLSVSGKYLQVTLNPDGASERYGYNQFYFSAGLAAWF